MAKKSEIPLESKHIKLFKGDFEELDRVLAGRIPASLAIRILIRKYLQAIKAKAEQQFQTVEVNLDDELANNPGLADEPSSDLQQEPGVVD